ncbi:hypothetical protein NQZ68_017307 [Dissostichus eleginoides]|nr:hypothetical protein NQZ68_017307 [Dissostichus eleginoides]
MIDKEQTSIQVKKLTENKDLTSADVQPDKAAVKMTKLEVCTGPKDVKKSGVQEKHPKVCTPDVKPEKAAVKTRAEVPQIPTGRQVNVAQSYSTQFTSVASAALKPSQAGTTFADTSKQDTVKPRETGIKLEVLKTKQEKPKEVKDSNLQEAHAKVSTKDVNDSPKTLDEESIKMEKILKGAEECILKPGKEATKKEHEITSVTKAKAPGIDIDQTSIQSQEVAENKNLSSADALPENTAVQMTRVEVGKGLVKEHGFQKEQQPSTQATKQEHKIMPVTIEKSSRIVADQTTGHLGTKLPENKDLSSDVVQPEKTAVKMTRLEVCTGPGVQEEHPIVCTPDVKPENAAIKTKEQVPQIPTESQKNVAQRDSTQLTSVASAAVKPSKAEKTLAEISSSKQDTVKPSETGFKLDVMKTTQESPEDVKVKDHNKQEVHAKVLTKNVQDSSRSLDIKSVKIEKIHGGAEVQVLQPGTQVSIKEQEVISVPTAKTSRIVIDPTCIHVEKVPENKDQTSADVGPEKASVKMTMIEVKSKETPKGGKDCEVQEVHAEVSTKVQDAPQSLEEKYVKTVKMTSIEVPESFTDSLSEPSLVPSALRERQATYAKDIKKEEKKEGKNRSTQEEEKEKIVNLGKRNVPLPMAKTPTTADMRTMDATQVNTADKIQTASLQAVHTSGIIWREVTLVEGSPSQENKAQAATTVRKPEKLVLEEPEESTVRKVFTEVQLLSGTGPTSPLTEGKPLEGAPEALISSTSDLENRLSRLVSRVLSCKNYPAELSPAAMAKQLEEAQECRDTAQAQVSLLSQLRESEAENKEALECVEDKWSTAVQDAAAVIQSKEVQLQLVRDYCAQCEAAKTTLERLTAELEAVRMSPEESIPKETERLLSLQRSMEENRTVLGELLLTYTKLCPHLSWSERATAQTVQKSLQEKWRGLERAVERNLYHTKVRFQDTSSLLSAISGLKKHLETIDKDLEAKSPMVTQWNCKKAKQLMVANAEVKAAQQTHLHLQQLSDVLLPSTPSEKETTEIKQGLQRVKDQIRQTEELISYQTQNSSNPIMEKMLMVMRDGLSWAKQTESDIEGRRKRVALLPENVHRQLRDHKKMQSEVITKQDQLELLVEEVEELLPQLDQAEEVPMVRSSLDSLHKLSESTTEKLAKAVREIESGLQTREKLSEQIADLESWVLAHLHKEASRSPDSELKGPADTERRVRQIQETLAEAEKQAAVCEALLMKSKDIAPELSISENCQLYDKLTNLQEDIRAISSYEKATKKELDDLTQNLDSSKKNVVKIETSLRQMLVDLSRHRFPITNESLQAFERFKHMILEHKSQADLLQSLIPMEKSKELYSVISELLRKMVTLEIKAKGHETYLNQRQCVEDLRESVQQQVSHTKDDSTALEDKYKVCQTLLIQLPLIRYMSEEAGSKLEMISADIYPSQLSTERQRLKKNEESLDTLELTLYNNLSIIELNLLKELDLDSEKVATQAFLLKTQQELQTIPSSEPNETVINNEYQRVMSLKKTVQSRMRALELLEQKKGNRQGSGFQDVMDLKKSVFSECDHQMANITQAKKSLSRYTCAVTQAAQFLREIEVSLLPPQGSAGLCSDRLPETQQALASLHQQFQTHVEQLQKQDALHPYLCPQKVEQLQENILSQLLVRMSTLQATGHIRLEYLSSCADHYRKYTKSQDEILQSVKSAESSLSQFICHKVTCLADCIDQQTKLGVLSEEVESLQRRLEEQNEWCPERSCRGGRESAVASVWKHVSRLRRCIHELTTRSKQRIAEWSEITNSVEKASSLLEQVEGEHPDVSRMKASTEDLQDLLQSWEQYQDSLDCEHRALSALELRTARLLGVPADLEQAPPTPLCQQLQAMQGRYSSVKQKSKEGLKAARMELEEREKLREEMQGVQVWLEAADGLLSEMQQSRSTQELQEVHSQLCNHKALLQRIMESLKMKYSDSLVPVEIESQLQEVTQSLQQVEVKVGEAVERSGPVHRLGAKLSEIQAGLMSVQKRLEQKSPNVTIAKFTQKRVWDELDVWHSCLAALEVDMQDLENSEEALMLTERLVEVQQLHSQLAKQAEQRTTLISKIPTWLQEHQEMISSSKSWMAEAKSWLATPCTYTTAKCLSSHVHTLQMVLDDSAQIRKTLQGFSSVLQEMSQVCDVTTLQEKLLEADQQVAHVQDSFTAPLSHLGHAADEVEAVETEVRCMENDVAEIKILLSSPETFPSPKEESFKSVELKIQSMRRTITEIQKCKSDLCLPEKAEETLTVFSIVEQLQALLLELEKKIPALFIQQPTTPVQTNAPSLQQTASGPQLFKSTSEDAEKEGVEGHIRIVRVKENVLKQSGVSLQTVEHSSAEQRQSPDRTQAQETEGATGQSTEPTKEDRQDVEGPTDPTEASSSEALSKPLGTVRTQTLPESMVNTSSTVEVSKSSSGSQRKCVVS